MPEVIDRQSNPNQPGNSIDSTLFQKSLPKLKFVELHRHLEGSLKASWLMAAAKEAGIQLPSDDPQIIQKRYEAPESFEDISIIWEIFTDIGNLFQSRKAVEVITRNVVADAAKEGIIYLELRFSPIYIAAAHNLSHKEVVRGVMDGVRAAQVDHQIDVGLILIIERQHDIAEYAFPLVSLAEHFMTETEVPIVAIDLANDELNHPPEKHEPVFREVQKLQLHTTVHAGELGSSDNIRKAVEMLGAERIGHGLLAFQDPKVEEMLRAFEIPLEVCPTSNFKCGLVTTIDAHPIRRYYSQGIITTLSTDDPGLFGNDLPGEYYLLGEALGFSIKDIREVLINSARFAFTSREKRAALEKVISDAFDEALKA